MRITSTGAAARPAFYDRNPLAIANTYRQTIAPAITTTRWTYTVPTGRKAFVGHALASMIRFTVAAPVGASSTWVVITPNGGSAADLVQIQDNQNAVPATDRTVAIGTNIALMSGDLIKGQTLDNSTGGTVYFDNSALTTEFDA